MARKKVKAKNQRKAQKHFEQGLLIRGEAVRSEDGKLPPGATHEIVEEGGKVRIVRRRFSAF